MMKFLIVSERPENLNNLDKGLLKHSNAQVLIANSSEAALAVIADKSVDLVIVDDEISGLPGKRFVEKMITMNPMINTALVSSLSEHDFHEDTEGLGVLMQIPTNPEESVATTVIERLGKVLSLYNRSV